MTEGIIAGFSELPALKQRVIVLKTQGMTHAAIAKRLQREFKAKTTRKTVDKWLAPSGALWPQYMELNEQLAEAALTEVRQLIQVYSSEAVITLRELSRPPHAPKVRVQAAKALATSLVAAVTKDAVSKAQPPAPPQASSELLAEIEREKQIYQLGEEALARREHAVEGEAANV